MAQREPSLGDYDSDEQAPQSQPMAKLPWGTLLVGAAVGLIVGLLIGWVFWPVQYTNATFADLNSAAKASYLASVAEAYANSNDAQVARDRLSDFGDNAADEVALAIEYYQANVDLKPNARIHMSNLQRMAADLGQSVVISPAAIPAATAVESQATATASQTDLDASQGGVADSASWFNWVLTLLVAGLLIGGGLYILRRVNRERSETGRDDNSDALAGGFDEESDIPSAAAGAPMRSGDDVFFDRVDATSTQTGDGPGGFDMDEADIDDPLSSQAAGTGRGTYSEQDEDHFPDELAAGAAAMSAASSQRYAPEEAAGTGPAATQNPPAADGVIDRFTAHYQAGDPDYLQTHNILDSASQRSIGECGMIVTSHGILDDDPTQVIALELWLFDKRDTHKPVNVKRLLFSEYVIDHGMEGAFTDEQQADPRPIVAQPDVNFQLKAEHLVLDCTIVEATYATEGESKGVFSEIQVEMVVRTAA